MKRKICGMVSFAFLVACGEKQEPAGKKEQAEISRQTEEINPLEDPTHFIGRHKTKAMILGVFHFHNPGLDSYKEKFTMNILEDKRQKELDTLLSKIAAFKPTKILIEWSRVDDDSLTNVKYQNYLNGSFDISTKTNEVYQVGFKLAKKLGHNKIYCSDASAEWFGAELDWEKFDDDAYMKSRGQYDKANRYNYKSLYALYDSLKTTQSLVNQLIMLNRPESRLKDHQAYLTNMLIEGAGDNYIGADGVARWYRRNLRIFSNVYDITDFNKEERLLLIYGSGHVWQLRQLFLDSPDFEYVEVNEYLKK